MIRATTTKQKNKWFFTLKEKPESQIRVIALPFAGGGPSAFHSWHPIFSDNIELIVINYPGRETRFTEKPVNDPEEMVSEIVNSLSDYSDKPFVLFGHSMGAMLAYFVTCELQRKQLMMPEILFVSGMRAPHIASRSEPVKQMNDEDLVNSLNKYGGMPAELFKNKELLQIFLPIIRADLEMLGRVPVEKSDNVNVPIFAYGGELDQTFTKDDLQQWDQYSDVEFKLHLMPGGHFYINQHRNELLRAIEDDISRIFSRKNGNSDRKGTD